MAGVSRALSVKTTLTTKISGGEGGEHGADAELDAAAAAELWRGSAPRSPRYLRTA